MALRDEALAFGADDFLNARVIELSRKAHLFQIYVQLDPVHLRQQIDEQIALLWKIAR